MTRVSPSGPIYQAGTLSGNPLSMSAGLATLREIERDADLYDRLERLGAQLEEGLSAAIRASGVPCHVARVGSMWTLFFCEGPVRTWSDAARCDTARFARFFHRALDGGILIAPSQFEANFISSAHSADDVAATVAALGRALEATRA
jgi:glutamate-1-semialdehyde 2,1-aminomutase